MKHIFATLTILSLSLFGVSRSHADTVSISGMQVKVNPDFEIAKDSVLTELDA